MKKTVYNKIYEVDGEQWTTTSITDEQKRRKENFRCIVKKRTDMKLSGKTETGSREIFDFDDEFLGIRNKSSLSEKVFIIQSMDESETELLSDSLEYSSDSKIYSFIKHFIKMDFLQFGFDRDNITCIMIFALFVCIKILT